MGGKIGNAAKAAAKILAEHFEEEEEYAFPRLGLLPLLAEGQATHEIGDALQMIDRLKAALHHMQEEHKAIIAAPKKSSNVARKEKKLQYVRFTDILIVHAISEEEAFYLTATILIGEYKS